MPEDDDAIKTTLWTSQTVSVYLTSDVAKGNPVQRHTAGPEHPKI